MGERRLSLLIHAGSKVGKSTIMSTAPGPILALDAEGSWRFVKVKKTYWDPIQGPPPIHDENSEWTVCVVTVRDFDTIQQVYRWLTQAPHRFRSVIIDSITELQRRCKANLKGQSEAMKIQDWDTILRIMDGVIRGYRDLTLMPGPVDFVGFVAETKLGQDGKWRPSMQGQIGNALPYWVDIRGYLYRTAENDENGQPTVPVNEMWITPHPQYEAGERVQGVLGNAVRVKDGDFTIAAMIDEIYDKIELQEVRT